MSKEKKEPAETGGFKVTDKRHFTSQGEVVEGRGPEKEPGPTPPPPSKEQQPKPGDEQLPPPSAGPQEDRGQEGEKTSAEKVDFTHLVMSLAGTAYHALGLPDPVTKEKGPLNLQSASQMIDLLSILQEKTRGNLSSQEEQILGGILTELKGLFVQSSGFVT